MTKEESNFVKLTKSNPVKAQDKLDSMYMDSMIGKCSQKTVDQYKNLFKEYN